MAPYSYLLDECHVMFALACQQAPKWRLHLVCFTCQFSFLSHSIQAPVCRLLLHQILKTSFFFISSGLIQACLQRNSCTKSRQSYPGLPHFKITLTYPRHLLNATSHYLFRMHPVQGKQDFVRPQLQGIICQLCEGRGWGNRPSVPTILSGVVVKHICMWQWQYKS